MWKTLTKNGKEIEIKFGENHHIIIGTFNLMFYYNKYDNNYEVSITMFPPNGGSLPPECYEKKNIPLDTYVLEMEKQSALVWLHRHLTKAHNDVSLLLPYLKDLIPYKKEQLETFKS